MKQKYKYSVRKVLKDYLNETLNEIDNTTRYSRELRKLFCAIQEKVEVKWCPVGGDYYYIDGYGETRFRTYTGSDFEKWHIKTGNCFPYTEDGLKQCEEYKQKLISLGETK